MTDREILQSVGALKIIKNGLNNDVWQTILRAMKQARLDERVQAGSDIQVACANGDLPDICEAAADFIIRPNNEIEPRR